MELWAIWLIIAGVLFITEMLTLTFYLLWLGIGALVIALFAWIAPDLFFLQVVAGAITALILTIFTKPLTRFIRRSKGYTDEIEELVGKQGIVLMDIEQGKTGIVKVGNETWSATSREHLLTGETVVVISRGNTIMEVKKWEGL